MLKWLIVALAALFVWPAQAAISFSQYAIGNTTNGTACSATFTNPIAAGSIIAVATGADPSNTFTFSDGHGDTATDSGLGVITNATIGASVKIVAFLTATSGAQTVTSTPTTNTFCEVAIWEIAGLTSAAVDKSVSGVSFNTPNITSGNTATLSSANEAAILYGFGQNNYASVGTGWTANDIVTAFGDITGHQVLSSTAPIAATATLSTSGAGVTSQILAVTFMSGGAPPPGGNPSLTLTGVGGF